MRLPNGMGSAYKMQGARRKPWIARKTVGYDDSGKQLYKIVGYFKTKKEAIEALGKTSNLSFNGSTKMLTVQEMFDKALPRENYSENTQIMYKSVFNKYCQEIKKLNYDRLTLAKMQSITDSASASSSKTVFSVFRLLDNYALEFDYIQKGYSSFIRVRKPQTTHIKEPFTYEEIRIIEESESPLAEVLMIYLYTGFRKQELLQLKKSSVFLDNDIPYIIGGSKTEAGKNRTIPIHSRILPIVRKFYINSNSDYLIKDITDKRIKTFLKNHNMNHCIHETRHTFRSELDRLNINKVTIDRLLGHANESIGEKVYTHKTLRELKEAIEQLRYK